MYTLLPDKYVHNEVWDSDRKCCVSYRLGQKVEQAGMLDDSVICNPIAVNKKGQVLQEIISLHQSLTRRQSRSSLKYDTSLLSRSGHRESAVPPEGKENLY
jgi:hypothetical protein